MPRTVTAALVLALVTGCSTGAAPRTAPDLAERSATPRARATSVPRPVAYTSFSATALVPSVPVHASPGGSRTRTLANPQASGAPLVFLVLDQQPGWVHVQLPVRPNGSTGWVRAADVRVSGVRYALTVRLAAHRLDVLRDGRPLRTLVIGVGTRETPTPGGTFYLKELLRAPDPTGPYGPYAYGLSGFSNQLTSFAGGDGVIGIHGTDQPALVGRDVSHGCIRLRNADIVALTRELPLGTPVTIEP